MVVFQGGGYIALTNTSINENSLIFTAVFKPSHNKELQYNCNEVTKMSLVVDKCSAIITIHILLFTVNITLK